jgi:hypothetical protein
VGLERVELTTPERVQPALERAQLLRTQRVDAGPRVDVQQLGIDEPALTQHPKVTAHGRRTGARRRGELAGTTGPLPQQVDHVPPRRICERRECLIEILHRLVND